MVSVKAQLRLRMSEAAILAQRAADKLQAGNAERWFNNENKKVWAGTTRSTTNKKGYAYWAYHAEQARYIASCKVEKQARKYWSKKAKQYQEKADAASS